MTAITYGITDHIGTIQIDNFDIDPGLPAQTTLKEITIVESLLSPVAQCIVTLQGDIYKPAGKDYDQHKNKTMSFELKGTGGEYQGLSYTLGLKTYRLDNRFKVQNNVSHVEEMTFHAVDETVLTDAKCLVSKSWKCTRPSEVVEHVLKSCLKASEKIVDSADPARDYIAENIHPFQVIAQQANVAVDGDDPSFIHFMTINEDSGNGVHHFQSLKKLTQEDPVHTFYFGEPSASGYDKKQTAISYNFPCDFDYISDLLNGLDENGKDQNSMAMIDPVFKTVIKKLAGGEDCDCGIGQFNFKVAQSNKETADQRNSCNLDVENHLLKRQARMGLLERDKVALRIVVPWYPTLHAGQVITFNWKNKFDTNVDVYGHGNYLIASLTHTIRMGGYAVTTMDCVATTVGQGIV